MPFQESSGHGNGSESEEEESEGEVETEVPAEPTDPSSGHVPPPVKVEETQTTAKKEVEISEREKTFMKEKATTTTPQAKDGMKEDSQATFLYEVPLNPVEGPAEQIVEEVDKKEDGTTQEEVQPPAADIKPKSEVALVCKPSEQSGIFVCK